MTYLFAKFKIYLRNHSPFGVFFALRAAIKNVPDAFLYRPILQPWRGNSEFKKYYDEISRYTLVTDAGAWTLYTLARQALHIEGDFLEAGVYRGGTALILKRILENDIKPRRLHLFDTFTGMPKTDKTKDIHNENDFSDTSLAGVKDLLGKEDFLVYHPGFIPDTFLGLETSRFAFAHVDVDIYQSVYDCCTFLYPRMSRGGVIVFDDYGLPSCPGARLAVDSFFANKPEKPLVLGTGQAVVFIVNSAEMVS